MDIAQLFHHWLKRLTHQEGNLRPTGSVEVRPCLYHGETYADEGDFVNGNFHGKGKMTYPDGKVEEGNWKDGDFIGNR